MLALRKTLAQPGGLSVDDIEPPAAPGPGQVRVRVLRAGICGTDLHIYKWGPFAARRMKLPTVLGHEMCVQVEAVGAGVTRVQPGMRASVESHVPCGHCYACNKGWSHVCPHTQYPGVDFDGGFASHTLLPESILWPVPDEIPTNVVAMMEPFGIAVHASLEGSGVSGQAVLVSGCGPIGLMNVAAARALGATRIIATDVNPLRLRMAATLGADRLVDVSRESALGAVKDLTRGNGVDVLIEYSGQGASLAGAAELIANGGELRLLGVPETDTAVNFETWLFKGLTVRNLHGRRLFMTWETSTALLAQRRVDLSALVSHTLPIQDAQRGFDACIAGQAIKVLFELGS